MQTRPFLPAVRFLLLGLAALALGAPALHAQQKGGQRSPRIGYIYPAGIQRGATTEIIVGGQFLEGVDQVLVSGSGVKVTVLKLEKPLTPKRRNELRMYLQEARKKLQESKDRPKGFLSLFSPEITTKLLKESGATDSEIKAFLEFRERKNDPKRQPNQQIAETLTLKVEVGAQAQTGPRSLRLLSPTTATNPLSFCIGRLPEWQKKDLLGKTLETAPKVTLPVILNGQIMPGDVDHFAFQSRKGARVVIAVQARDLIPYLADAVPGWFQPVVALYDDKGKEVAYANDFRFSPDPVLCYEVPNDGNYLLEIRDALYRGREDFVYRVTVGEVPFVTGIFPMGGYMGVATPVSVGGWNLTRTRSVVAQTVQEGIHPVPELSNGFVIGDVPFASDALPDTFEQEPNNSPREAQKVKFPIIINGRIQTPGDVDVFAFTCTAGTQVVAEVNARRLGSPLDSYLKVTDVSGKQIAFNDDWEDQGSALLTHKADSYLTFTAPATGLYYVHLSDAQRKGGPEYAYRLRLSSPHPDFALRLVPSSLNARPGATVPVTIYALRKDGFAGEIRLQLKDAPEGFLLSGGIIPAGQDKVRATLTFPQTSFAQPIRLQMFGETTVGKLNLTRQAVPADDMIQAFMYHHLVPAHELLAVCSGPDRGRAPIRITSEIPMRLPKAGAAKVLISSKWRVFDISKTHLELSEPPEGITFEGAAYEGEGVALTFRADPAKVKPGLSGNLILEAFGEFTTQAKEGKPGEKKRYPMGFLPAVPFKIVDR